eukprot:9401113-Pyramimonas_sp.AAC.1
MLIGCCHMCDRERPPPPPPPASLSLDPPLDWTRNGPLRPHRQPNHCDCTATNWTTATAPTTTATATATTPL